MPRIIQTIYKIYPEESVLVRSSYLHNNIKASRLLSEARRRAKNIVEKAHAESGQIFEKYRSEGYATGVTHAVHEMVNYLTRHVNLAAQLQERLYQQVRVLLHSCMAKPEVVMATFEEILRDEKPDDISHIDILLPEAFRLHKNSLLEVLDSHLQGRHVNFTFHEDMRFLLRVGDYVTEFAPEDFVNLTTGQAMGSLPSIYKESKKIADTCRQNLLAIFTPGQSSEDQHS